MFCNRCGAKNSDEAIFCQKCGLRFDGEEETKVARPPRIETEHKDERQIFSIRPTLLFVKIGYAAAIAGAFLLVALLVSIDNWLKFGISPWIFVLAGLSLLLVPAFYHLRRNVVRYTLTDSKVEIDEGFISQKTRNVPLRTIQDVSVSAGVTQRMLGFGDLVIENASDAGGKIILKNVNSPKKYADALLKQMRRLDK
ncbi:MAG: PH domain-containing protein [Pyrinomonadaceae bacterium]